MTIRPRIAKDSINAMKELALHDLAEVRSMVGETQAMVSVETFIALAFRIFAQTNPSKLKEEMRLMEIRARLDMKDGIK